MGKRLTCPGCDNEIWVPSYHVREIDGQVLVLCDRWEDHELGSGRVMEGPDDG